MDDVFKALADPSRRRLLDSLHDHNGQTLRELCADLDMARQSVSKHLAALEQAQLVVTARRGREKLHFLNAAPITAIGERWIRKYDQRRAQALSDLTNALEQQQMDDNAFVYVTYVRTTPEKLWQALTDPAFTARYWGVSFETDWSPGSPMTWSENGRVISDDPEQVVLVYEPYRRLAYAWHTFTPEWAEAVGKSEESRAQLAAEPRSRVTFELEPMGESGAAGDETQRGLVRLTVTHGGFPAESLVRASVSEGWPALLASLKTLLETGETLTTPGSLMHA